VTVARRSWPLCSGATAESRRCSGGSRRGTPLTWAAVNGRVESVRALVGLGADPNQRGTFGGLNHGEGVTAIHLAAQAGRREAVVTLLDLGADPLIRDDLHGGTALGWARVGGHEDLADVLP
jgi:ankyrin repeat protein